MSRVLTNRHFEFFQRITSNFIGKNAMFEGLFQPMHLLLILVIALVVFGPGKLPELGSSLGKAIRDFKKAIVEPETKEANMGEAKKLEDKEE
jgi:sec-independent protein translocase protein TatA